MSLREILHGRASANAELVDSFFKEEKPWTAASLEQLLQLTGAPLLATADPRWAAQLSATGLVDPEGCFEQFDRSVCLFHPRPVPELPKLHLDRDGQWEQSRTPAGWPLAQLRATRSGVLDYTELGRCRLAEITRLGPFSWTRLLAFLGAHLRGARFEAGEVMLSRESRQVVFRLPVWARPTRTYAVRCG